MPFSVQARFERLRSRFGLADLRCAAVLVLLPLAACTSDNVGAARNDVEGTPAAEVAANAAPPEADQLSDQATIRNAVSSADIEGLAGQPLAWVNSDTGSRGAITAMNEERQNGKLCRKFTTSRESFEGVSLYQGEACMAQAGVWRLLDFKPL